MSRERQAEVADRAPTANGPNQVRNVALVGPSGSGKTTLAETLLAATSTVSRPGSVAAGTTVSDHEPVEQRQERSVSLSVLPFEHDGIKVNLIDTPGYADYVGELRSGLRAVDCVLFVISTAEGVDGATRLLWDECAAVDMPRSVVLTKLDAPRADLEGTLAACQDAFGEKVLPLYLPVRDDAQQVCGLLALLTNRHLDHSGDRVTVSEPTQEQVAVMEPARGSLLEGIIEESEDETLMDRYLSGEQIDTETLVTDLEKAVARGSFHPAVPVCSTTGVGVTELLEIMTSAFPGPDEHPMPTVTDLNDASVTSLTCDPAGPLVAEVVKTTSDPYLGRISLVRVFSGTLGPDQVVHVSGHFSTFFGEEHGHPDHDEDERVGALSSPLGKHLRSVPAVVAGDIAAVAKLSQAETGDTLSSKDRPLVMRPWSMPEPLLPVAVEARSKGDEDKLLPGLHRLAAEDPSVRVEQNPETGQLVLWAMGEAHVEVLLERLENRYGAAVNQTDLRVPLRETFSGPAAAKGRHVKQSGGHGQFAVCDIEVEPLPEGGGFEFVDKVVGGSVPRQFIPSVEKGIRAQMAKGLSAGYPVVDIRVTLLDGKAHSVDSSDMAFQTAGGLALKEAAAAAGIRLLEPVDEVAILVADEHVGSIMGDLSARRGRVLGTDQAGPGRTLVNAEIPQVEIVRYAIDLRSMSQGTGSFTRSFLRYEPMPDHVAAKVAG